MLYAFTNEPLIVLNHTVNINTHCSPICCMHKLSLTTDQLSCWLSYKTVSWSYCAVSTWLPGTLAPWGSAGQVHSSEVALSTILSIGRLLRSSSTELLRKCLYKTQAWSTLFIAVRKKWIVSVALVISAIECSPVIFVQGCTFPETPWQIRVRQIVPAKGDEISMVLLEGSNCPLTVIPACTCHNRSPFALLVINISYRLAMHHLIWSWVRCSLACQ